MSKIIRIKTSVADNRGSITDIFTNEVKDHCTIVTFTKNSIRGNHYHKESIQSAYILEGTFKIFHVKVDTNSKFDLKKVEEISASQGDYVTHYEYEAHTYKCISSIGKLIVFTKGIRGGESYEKDTFRLDKNLAQI